MGSRLRRTLVVATIMLSGVPLRPAEADSPAEQSVVPVGEQVADFQLRDGYGSPHALDDYRDAEWWSSRFWARSARSCDSTPAAGRAVRRVP